MSSEKRYEKDVDMRSQFEDSVVGKYLALMDEQREKTFADLNGISPEQLWKRPAPGEWSIGEILHHNLLLIQSVSPMITFAWWFRWVGEWFKNKPYKTEIEDPYRKSSFPHWTGFIWKPKYSNEKQVPFSTLVEETRQTHQKFRTFYEGKDEAVLGHVYLFDPLFGFFNLIQALKIGIYHDQLHYDDVIAQWRSIDSLTNHK
jgi:hypothetical protein